MKNKDISVIRFPALQKKLGGISRSTIDRWEKYRNLGFPKRLHLGENAIGWDMDEIDLWLKNRREKVVKNGQ